MSPQRAKDDKKLLHFVTHGDERAFAELFKRYHHVLGAHIYGITKSKEQTEEIVQDCFLKVWVSRETLTEVKSFRALLFINSRNAAISTLRKNLRRQDRYTLQPVNEIVAHDDGQWKLREQYLSIMLALFW